MEIVQKRPTVVYDILGPMYHYDAAGWPEDKGAVVPLIELIKRHNFAAATLREESEVEERMLASGLTTPLITPGFVESAIYVQRAGGLPVIVTAGTPGTAAITLEAAARDYQERTGERVDMARLFPDSCVHSTLDIGSKAEPATWMRAVWENHGIVPVVATYEDSLKNLEAATAGLQGHGFHVVHDGPIQRVAPNLYKGSMRALQPVLEELCR